MKTVSVVYWLVLCGMHEIESNRMVWYKNWNENWEWNKKTTISNIIFSRFQCVTSIYPSMNGWICGGTRFSNTQICLLAWRSTISCLLWSSHLCAIAATLSVSVRVLSLILFFISMRFVVFGFEKFEVGYPRSLSLSLARALRVSVFECYKSRQVALRAEDSYRKQMIRLWTVPSKCCCLYAVFELGWMIEAYRTMYIRHIVGEGGRIQKKT